MNTKTPEFYNDQFEAAKCPLIAYRTSRALKFLKRWSDGKGGFKINRKEAEEIAKSYDIEIS